LAKDEHKESMYGREKNGMWMGRRSREIEEDVKKERWRESSEALMFKGECEMLETNANYRVVGPTDQLVVYICFQKCHFF
jgi:hypothetical protein